jgi:hypothetical protein
MENIKPSLVEPGVKYFIGCTLKQCRDFKDKYITLFFNIGMFIFLVILISGVLMYRYKGKPTPAEVEIKKRQQMEFINSKLRMIADIKKKTSEVLITDLPNWNDHPELGILQGMPKY